jgi:DNA polymerase-1
MHGIPRPSDYYGRLVRAAFVARPGYKLVIADYSQAELRAFAAESNDPSMLAMFNEDRDPHDETAKLIAPAVRDFYGWDYNDPDIPDGIKKEIRTTAKNVNFGEVYGGGASGIAGMLGGKLPVNVVGRILDAKRKAQPVADNWKQTQFRLAKAQGFVQSRFGRKRRFPLITDDNLDDVRKACVHAIVAGTASDLTLLSIVQLVNAGVMVVGTWHDSIIAEAPMTTAEHTAHLMREVMILTGERYVPQVKWDCDVEIRDRWVDPPTE